jgi:hypothetical protein
MGHSKQHRKQQQQSRHCVCKKIFCPSAAVAAISSPAADSAIAATPHQQQDISSTGPLRFCLSTTFRLSGC